MMVNESLQYQVFHAYTSGYTFEGLLITSMTEVDLAAESQGLLLDDILIHCRKTN